MPRPKKNQIDEIINKMKDIYPEQTQLINTIVNNVNPEVTKKKTYNNYFVVDKDIKNNYYLDDNNGVWNDKLQIIGAHENGKVFLYDDIKKTINKILNKK